jgi:hypothetical protein
VQASGIDPAAHSVSLDDGRPLTYGSPLLAMGSQARRLPIAGNDLPGVFTLRTIEDANAILAAVGSASAHWWPVVVSWAVGCLRPDPTGCRRDDGLSRNPAIGAWSPVELSAALRAKYEGEGWNSGPATPERLMGHERVDHAILRDKGPISWRLTWS